MPHPPHSQLNWDTMSIRDILELALADEEEAREYYRRAADLTGNESTRRMLLGLADMEQGHADALRKELEELKLQADLEAGIAD
jgi:rubrerythrin